MKLSFDGMFGKETLIKEFGRVEEKLKKDGKVLILSGESVYSLSVTNANDLICDKQKLSKLALVEAMKKVLESAVDYTMHSNELAEEITNLELFFKKDGSFVTAVQIRSCANNNPDLFECLEKNFIKLKK